MKNTVHLLALTIGLFFIFSPSAPAVEKAETVRAEARVLKDRIKIGDEIRLLLQIEHPRKFTITPPDEKLDLSPFEIKRVEPVPVRKGQNRVQQTFRLTLTVFETGDLKIPPIPVQVFDEQNDPSRVLTEPVPIKVLSVGKKLTDKDDIRPIKAPVSVGLGRFWSGLYGLLAAALAVFLVVKIVLRKLREREDAESRKPPHERVEIELKRLKDHGFLEEKNHKAFYSELSDILRRYLERRFQVDALELTSAELLAELERRSFEKELRDAIHEVLDEADLVKFAKLAPPYPLAERLEALIRQVVGATSQK